MTTEVRDALVGWGTLGAVLGGLGALAMGRPPTGDEVAAALPFLAWAAVAAGAAAAYAAGLAAQGFAAGLCLFVANALLVGLVPPLGALFAVAVILHGTGKLRD